VTAVLGFGVIPVVSQEAGIDTDDFGFTLAQKDSKTIAGTVQWIASQDEDWHKQMSQRVFAAYQVKFSQQAFLKHFKEMLIEFIVAKE